jgi:hypothetical protein
MDAQVRLLGWLYIFYHGLSLVVLAVAAFIAGAIGLFTGEVEGLVIGSAIACGLFAIGIVTVLPGIIAGWGLLNYRPWARILAIIVALLDIWSIPFGTALAIFAIYTLFSGKSDRVFNRRYDYHYG